MARYRKRPSIFVALIPIISLIALLSVFILVLDQDVHIPLIASAVVATIVAATVLERTWDEIEEGILRAINMGMQAVLILMVIGILIGSWIASGIVPTLIYYGLMLIHPFFWQ